ncbi:hypothetical protein NUU61_008751 [Penicillium alfredii]|uniref:Altered inheritance of mitochondria protein 9, mitochondrial n=1 Tax=Penicillium alfredii TaxID=1506179 RepID=A0A9W9ELT4_9EURO|nr:uncharacterized protein NUU61_008751 [Penicillium alfredii]KAJ5084172.1 hypothetical protein NUU61_008751 [Penicillium alfredii]
MRSFCKTKKHSDPEFENLFRYTSGRWLWDEEQQLRDRCRAFNLVELQNLAAKAIGSNNCVSITKLAEGGYNKVFRLVLNDDKVVLARIPNPNAGPPFYTTASEVATMEFARNFLRIRVPRVLEWNATASNPVGSEYIIMEEAAGTPLEKVWNDMSPDSKLSIMKEVVSMETKMLSISFSHYGGIYFASDAVEGAVPAQITTEVPAEFKEQVSKTFTVGPTTSRDFWNKERSMMNLSRGPRSSPKDCALCSDDMLVSSAQSSPRAHLQLLERYLRIAPSLVDIDAPLTRSTLWHTDLHSSNLFVDDSHVTAVIDWQSVWAGPLFLQAQPSPLVDYQGSILLQRPDNFDNLDPKYQA